MIDAELNGISSLQVGMTDELLERIYMETLNVTLHDLGRKPIDYNTFTQEQVRNIINTVWNDEHYSSRIYGTNSKIARRLKQDITDMVVLGKNPDAIKQKLMDDLNIAYHNADRLVRTEAAHFYNTAAMDGYKQAGVKQVEVLIGHDERTCDRCNANVGVYNIGTEPMLPTHPRCRCCYAPIIEQKETGGIKNE